MKLNIITHTEFLLSPEDFKIEFERNKKRGMQTNQDRFSQDLLEGRLDRYKIGPDSYVIYKDGVLCGHSTDKVTLHNTATYHLSTPNITLFKVPKLEEKCAPSLESCVEIQYTREGEIK